MTTKKLKVLFVASGRKSKSISSTIRNQGESLQREGLTVNFFMLSGRGWKGYLSNVKSLRSEIKNGDYDVIHAHYGWTAYLTSLAMCGLRNPLVVSLMGSDLYNYWWAPLLAKFVANVKPWSAVIVKSNEMKHRLGLKRAIVLPNGVNMDVFHEMEKSSCQTKLGWNGRHNHVLFPADPMDVRKNWSLAEKAVKNLNISGKYQIELHGMINIPNNDTPIWYNAADVVVLPSFYEGSANAVKEAMACNRPLVTTDMGDCRERIEGVAGCYVANSYNVAEFTELLMRALEYIKKTRGRERLMKDEISASQIARKLTDIYENVNK